MLDADPQVDFARDRGLKPVYELPYRGFGNGAELQKAVDASRGTGFSTTLMGEVLPRFENHVSIDKGVA